MCKRIFCEGRYPGAFLGTLSSLYVNGGFKTLYTIALREILRTHYKMPLDKLQVVMSFVYLPWDFKVLYGVTCDTVRVPFFKTF